MRLTKFIPERLRPIASRLFACLITPVNVVWYYVFHKKFLSNLDQKAFWQSRNEDDFQTISDVESDPYYQRFDQLILSRLIEKKSASYLEVGCYCGYRLNRFAKDLPGADILGVDLGFGNLKFGKENIVVDERIALVNANACWLPLKNDSIETVYTIVCLTHIDYSSIHLAIRELARVCSANLVLVEVDHRPMTWRRKLNCLNWSYGYMHRYEELVGDNMTCELIEPIYDDENHPRYTLFDFKKCK